MQTRQFIVGERESNARLDLWLTHKMPDLSRGQIKHLLDQGKILVNGRRVLIAGWELEPQDTIEMRIPEIKKEARSKKQEARPERHRFLDVIYEDKDIIVVDKPAGVLSEPKGGSPHDNLFGMIKGYLKRKFKESRGSYVKLLHRLDRETSGVLVAAKSKIGEQLETQFRSHKVDREYVAIVEGPVEQEEGRIDFHLEKGDFKGGQKVRVVKKGEGVSALTLYRVRERYERATLLDVQVETGRTHQVRVHLAEIGHPLIGDKIYGSTTPFPRHALHSSILGFKHPRTGNRERFEAKLPEDLEKLIDQLRGS